MPKCIYKNRFGRQGEEAAKSYLTSKGYRHIKSNYRYQRAEVDLIFADDERKILLFVEVKSRKNYAYGAPEEAVTLTKLKQLYKAVDGFVSEDKEFTAYNVRIDILTCMFTAGKINFNHIENVSI